MPMLQKSFNYLFGIKMDIDDKLFILKWNGPQNEQPLCVFSET